TANTPADVLPALDRLSKGLRERIGESLKGLRNTEKLEQVSTGSLEALRHFTEGTRLADVGRYDDAVAPLRRAVAVDSTFAMAWRKLAVVLGNARLPAAERVAAATKAYEYRARLPEIERHLAVAFYHYAVDHDPDQVVAAYRAVLQLDPGNDAALNNLAIELGRENKHDEAAELIERALAQGSSASFYTVLVNTRLDQGRPAEALAVLDRMRRDLPEAPEEPLLRAGVLARMGQYDSAEAGFRSILDGKSTPTTAQASSAYLTHLGLIRGRLDVAVRESERFVEISRSRQIEAGPLQVAIGRSITQSLIERDTAAARRTLAAALARTPLDSLDPLERPYGRLVEAYARIGDVARAKQLLAEYQRVTPEVLQHDSTPARWMRTNIALGEQRPRDAITTIRAIRESEGCTRCGRYLEGLAWEALAQPDSAATAYEASLGDEGGTAAFFGDAFARPQVHRQLGALYEARGDRTKAVEQYTAFLDLWRDADPVLQPQVREVKERLSRLVGEGER
ncbi:MAG TPA: tetratricopeptide repeat protein, partial [Gemmatimonadales bacterium]|nr:tetratricopeptide repeat protein [Gemmatimonadales bacterium]